MGKKMFKIFLVQLFIVMLVFSFFYYKSELDTNLETTNKERKIKDLLTISSNTYEDLEDALLEAKENITIKNSIKYKDPGEIFDILEKISLDNPKVMYYSGANYSLGNLTISYSKSKEDLKRHQNKIDTIAEEFLKNNINSTMSDYEKILKAHDYIIENSRYDERIKIEGSVPPESNSSYGVLGLGVGVCEGYAKAFKHLLDALDIDSIVVVGDSKGENHAWNLVDIDGDYYHIDPTWDDPLTNDGSNILRHNYFNLTDEEISKTHFWDRDKYPPADNDRYNYFTYNDLVVLGQSGLEKKMQEAIFHNEEKVSVKIINYDFKGIRIDEIINELVFDYREQINLKSYTYSLDEEQGIISFKFSYY